MLHRNIRIIRIWGHKIKLQSASYAPICNKQIALKFIQGEGGLKNYPASIYWRSPINQTDFSKYCEKSIIVSNKTQEWWCWCSKFVGLGSCLIIASVLIASLQERVFAQITPDATLPTNSSVTRDGNIFNIIGGTKAGSNLFHSFSEFSVPPRGTAYFNNALDIQNIISRVTGGSASNIDGLIRANAPANLFLINPKGIIFGQRARLDVKGSFVATTANAIAFGDKVIFSATNPTTSPLLTINPSAFLFNQIPTAPIQNNSANLSVKNNLSLLLVGGDINLNGGSLKASGGRVELGGLAQEGIVGLNVNDHNLSLNFPPDLLRASLSLTKGAEVDVTSNGGGSIAVNAQNIDISEKSSLRAGIKPLATAANAKAGDITLSAKETVTVKDSSIYNAVFGLGDGGSIRVDAGKLIIQDGIVATATTSSGSAGDLVMNASDSIELTGSSSSNGTIDIFPINLYGFSPKFTVPIGLLSASLDAKTLLPRNLRSLSSFLPTASGNAGNLTIETGRLIVSNGAVVSAATTSTGKGGNLTVKADLIELTGTSANDSPFYLFSITSKLPSGLRNDTDGRGSGGNLTIDTRRLIVRDGAWVITGTGNKKPEGKLTVTGGELIINATDSVELSGTSSDNIPSVLASGTQGSKNANKLVINTKKLMVSNGGIITTGTSSSGNGGELIINATDSVELVGTSKQGLSASQIKNLIGLAGASVLNFVEDRPFPSGVISGSANTGNAGKLTINTGRLLIQGGAQASVSTISAGNAGNLNVRASSIELSGTSLESPKRNDIVGRSLLTTAVGEGSTGKGGDITVITNSLTITDGAALTASTSGQGEAGKITVNATDKVIISGSDFSYDDLINNFTDKVENIGANSGIFVSSTGSGTTGDIEINSPKITLDNQGKLNAESASGNGGNININSDLLLLRRNSQISTNAGTDELGGDGGNININSRFIVAVPNENSDITANAFTGSGGRVDITTNGIFGIVSQKSSTENSDITASSQLGVNGEVTINSPDTDPSRGLIQLPSKLVDASQQIAQGCTPRGRQTANRFIATGRGGLPLSPNEPLRGRAVITGWVDLPPQATQRVTDKLSTVSVSKSTNQIVEAQGWIVDGKGDVILVAQSGQSSSIPSAMSCSQ